MVNDKSFDRSCYCRGIRPGTDRLPEENPSSLSPGRRSWTNRHVESATTGSPPLNRKM